MSGYEQYSKEELIQRVKELEKQVADHQNIHEGLKDSFSKNFQQDHGSDILNILPDMLSIFDHNYNFIALASSEKTVHVGNSSSDLVGKNLLEILPPDAYIPVKENFDRVLETGKPSIGYHNLNIDGHIENFENRVVPLGDNKHILCICRNISERVKAENQLQMITSAVNNSLEDVYAVKIDGTLIFANKQFISHYNIINNFTSLKIFDILEEENFESWNVFLQQVKEAGGSYHFTTQHKFCDGTIHAIEISTFILKDNTGEKIIWSIGRDITERIKQEKQIYELNQLMDTILNNIPVYLFVKDTNNDFRYLYWNKELEESSKIQSSLVIGKTDAEIFPNKKDAKKFKQDDLELVKNNLTIDFEEDYTTATGEVRKVHTIKTLVPSEGRKPLLIGISWDITEQKATELALIEARNKAEESDKLKTAFLANMSHEIRTPLNAIVGFSKLIAENIDNNERLEYAEIVDKNTDLLLQLINDILDLSKIEAGMLEFEEKPVALNELCQSIYGTFQPRIQEGVKLIYNKNAEETITCTDHNRVVQILTNLLNNACKFTSSGEICFGYKQKEQQVEFYVRDTGMGIAAENINKIFNRFIKLNSFIQGTGLGLPICQMIVENLGGKIKVTSTLNQGTEFRFTLPWKPEKSKTKLQSQL